MKKLFMLAALVLTAVAMGIAAPKASAREITPSVVPTFDCVGFCMICQVFEIKYMTIPATPSTPANDTDSGASCGHHTECQFECRESLLNVQNVTRVVATAEASALIELMARSPGVEFNRERRALQVVGCDGDRIVASFPLSRELAIDIEAAENLRH